jgi:hypothetical protein
VPLVERRQAGALRKQCAAASHKDADVDTQLVGALLPFPFLRNETEKKEAVLALRVTGEIFHCRTITRAKSKARGREDLRVIAGRDFFISSLPGLTRQSMRQCGEH